MGTSGLQNANFRIQPALAHGAAAVYNRDKAFDYGFYYSILSSACKEEL
jgi:hypothetical protein